MIADSDPVFLLDPWFEKCPFGFGVLDGRIRFFFFSTRRSDPDFFRRVNPDQVQLHPDPKRCLKHYKPKYKHERGKESRKYKYGLKRRVESFFLWGGGTVEISGVLNHRRETQMERNYKRYSGTKNSPNWP